MGSKRRYLRLFATLSFLASSAAGAEILFQGRVTDSDGGALAGAEVSAWSEASDTKTSTRTDLEGRFRLELDPGDYEVTVSATGFMGRMERLSLSSGAPSHDFQLDLLGYAERIDVAADDPYLEPAVRSATKTPTPLRDVPQAVSVVTSALIADQRLQSMADVVRYMPGVGMGQGEGNRDTPIFRGNSSTSDFLVDGVRDDVQYFRDTYNVDRVEALKGPNGMIFGRGGAGGVINRVIRRAEWDDTREISLQLGSWENRRVTADLGQGLSASVAARVNALYEDSDSYRDGVSAERWGVNPTFAFTLGAATTLRASLEHFEDQRTADRGVSSHAGRPLATAASTFFGDAARSDSQARADLVSLLLEHAFAPQRSLRSRLSYGDYEKFYQNVFAGSVNGAATHVALQAYNNDGTRQNLFHQTDLMWQGRGRGIEHTLLAGLELGRQQTDSLRHTGYFTTLGPNVTSASVPLSRPTTALPLAFRPSPTDADNESEARIAALYVQDQIRFSPRFQAVVGLRYDRFEVDFKNRRDGAELESRDGMLAPRLGLIFKPVEALSLYGSYGLSYQPRAGEHLGSLTASNANLDPEEFVNYELGAKWEPSPHLSLTAALYRLERANVVAPDPVDPARSVLVDGQESEGLELGFTGRLTRRWTITGGYAWQDGEITHSLSATARAGARLAQLPEHSASLWNRYDVSSRWGLGLGLVHRGEIFTATDNLVTVPAYSRVDAALFLELHARLHAQLNVENLADEDYFVSAHSNTNITPGSPRALKVTLSSRF